MPVELHKAVMPVPKFKPLDRVKIHSCGWTLDGRITQVVWTRGGISYNVEFTAQGYFYDRFFLEDELQLATPAKKKKPC